MFRQTDKTFLEKLSLCSYFTEINSSDHIKQIFNWTFFFCLWFRNSTSENWNDIPRIKMKMIVSKSKCYLQNQHLQFPVAFVKVFDRWSTTYANRSDNNIDADRTFYLFENYFCYRSDWFSLISWGFSRLGYFFMLSLIIDTFLTYFIIIFPSEKMR